MLDKAAFESPGVHQVKQLAELPEGNACWTGQADRVGHQRPWLRDGQRQPRLMPHAEHDPPSCVDRHGVAAPHIVPDVLERPQLQKQLLTHGSPPNTSEATVVVACTLSAGVTCRSFRWTCRSFRWSFHQPPLGTTAAHLLDDPPNLSSKDSTRQHTVDDPRLSCKQQVGGSSPPASSQSRSLQACSITGHPEACRDRRPVRTGSSKDDGKRWTEESAETNRGDPTRRSLGGWWGYRPRTSRRRRPPP
jgi:hypothetical protein